LVALRVDKWARRVRIWKKIGMQVRKDERKSAWRIPVFRETRKKQMFFEVL
jgi:hypothetical protein